MEVIDIPIVDFYKNCVDSARNARYAMVITLISRKGDQPDVYSQCINLWESLHDLTGNLFLFLFSSAEIKNDFNSYGESGLINSYTLFTNNSMAIPTGTRLYTNNLKRLRYLGEPNLPYNQSFVAKQSLQVSLLMNYLNINERDIPSLHFFSLHSKKSYFVSLANKENFNIYECLKLLFEETYEAISKLKEIENKHFTLKTLLRKYVEKGDYWFVDQEKDKLLYLIRGKDNIIDKNVVKDLFDLVAKKDLSKRRDCWEIFNRKIKPHMLRSEYSKFQKFIDRSLNLGLQLKLEKEREIFSNLSRELIVIEYEFSNSIHNFELALENYINSDFEKIYSYSNRQSMIVKEIELLANKGIPDKIKIELTNIKEIFKIEYLAPMKTLFCIAKILEDSLKNKYNEHNLNFNKLIELSFSKNDISSHEFHLLNGLRCLRNIEAHTLDSKIEKNIIVSAILTGLVIINKLYE